MIVFPSPQTAPLTGGPVLRWGILGPGWIAGAWAETVLANTEQRLVAVASSQLAKAQAFADAYGIPSVGDDYERLVTDPNVDAVYIAGVNAQHLPHALLAIAAGKHVLVEKPLGSTAAEARQIADAARAAGVLVMEALWTRFLPQTDVLLRMIAEGDLGDVGIVEAAFVPRLDPRTSARVYEGGVHGGALLDLGVYPLSFAQSILGAAESFTVSGTILDSGADGRTIIIQEYASGARSISVTAVDLGHLTAASVLGTRGSVRFPEHFHQPGRFVYTDGSVTAEYTDPNGFTGLAGLAYQVTAFADAVGQGLTESRERPLADSIAVLELIDAARHRIGAPSA